jgi:thiamine biosynthesis lipoprotein
MFRLLLLVITVLSAACSSPSDVHETRFIMGTLVEFTIAESNQDQAEKAVAEAAVEMQRIEDIFTIYGDVDNSVKAFNASPVNTIVKLDDEVAAVLEVALKIQRQSLGAFDPALGGLNLLWGFSLPEPTASPPPEQAIRQAVPPANCIVKKSSGWLRADKRCLLDFGAIAKGYAIDRGIAVLRNHGIRHAIINAGGDIRLIGRHGDRPWRIGIRHPRNKSDVVAALELEGDASVVTSGDYERFFISRGRRYHHILSPATGWPAGGAQSATVIAPNATLADAWSTALFVSGVAGLKLMDEMNFKALIVDNKGVAHKNKSMSGLAPINPKKDAPAAQE